MTDAQRWIVAGAAQGIGAISARSLSKQNGVFKVEVDESQHAFDLPQVGMSLNSDPIKLDHSDVESESSPI